MPTIKESYRISARHSLRVRIYRALVSAVLILFLCYFAFLFFPLLFSSNNVVDRGCQDVSDLQHGSVMNSSVMNSSVMLSPAIDGYDKQKKIYSINARQSRQDYDNIELLYLDDVDGKFYLPKGAILKISSKEAIFDKTAKRLRISTPTQLQLSDISSFGGVTKIYADLVNADFSNNIVTLEKNLRVSNEVQNFSLTAEKMFFEPKSEQIILKGCVHFNWQAYDLYADDIVLYYNQGRMLKMQGQGHVTLRSADGMLAHAGQILVDFVTKKLQMKNNTKILL